MDQSTRSAPGSGLARMLALLGVLPRRARVGSRAAREPDVVVLTATGVVDSVLAGYLRRGSRRPLRGGAAAVVVELNTPGGSLDATQRITAGAARGRRAGDRVGRAGRRPGRERRDVHHARREPGLHGARARTSARRRPSAASGEDIPGTLGDKVRNDAIANITAIAEARGRPVDWAVSTVDEAAVATPASEAVAAGAVDGIAATIDEVLAQADGTEVTVNGVPQDARR